LYIWKFVGAVSVTGLLVKPYPEMFTVCVADVVAVNVVNVIAAGVVKSVGGGVHVISLFAAGEPVTPEENVVDAVVDDCVARSKRSVALFEIPIVAEEP
jgi:hypothetical protein